MEEDVPIPGLKRHPDSGIFLLRIRVPDDLRPSIGKREIKRSLKTTDRQEAIRRFHLEAKRAHDDFALARKRIEQKSLPKPHVKLSLTDIQTLVGRWFQDLEREAIRRDSGILQDEDCPVDELASDIGEDLRFLYANSGAEIGEKHSAFEEYRTQIEERILNPHGLHLELDSDTKDEIARLMVRGMIETRKRSMQRLMKRSTLLHFPQDWNAKLVGGKPDALFGIITENSKEVVADPQAILPRKTLHEAAEQYLADFSKRKTAPKTPEDYRVVLNFFMDFIGKNKPLGIA